MSHRIKTACIVTGGFIVLIILSLDDHTWERISDFILRLVGAV